MFNTVHWYWSLDIATCMRIKTITIYCVVRDRINSLDMYFQHTLHTATQPHRALVPASVAIQYTHDVDQMVIHSIHYILSMMIMHVADDDEERKKKKTPYPRNFVTFESVNIFLSISSASMVIHNRQNW